VTEQSANDRGSREDRPRRSSGAYEVAVVGAVARIDLDPNGVRVDGRSETASLREIPGSPIRVLRVGDAIYEVVARRGDRRGAYAVTIAGVRVDIEALDARARAVRSFAASAATTSGPEPVRAPMPGMVVRVLVAPGDVVRAGDGLVIMEAMKMENELRAKSAGRVRAVLAAPGTAVEKGAVLVTLE
jgi:biotin carboxyl carrier protein